MNTNDSLCQLNLLCGEIAERDLAYIAGLFDGEGCISTIFSKCKNEKHHLVLRITISNTNKETLEWVRSILGGNVQTKSKPVGYKILYEWRVSHRLALKRIASALHPYLKIKKRQAELLLELLAMFKPQPGSGIINGKQTKLSFPDDYWHKVEVIVENICNQKRD